MFNFGRRGWDASAVRLDECCVVCSRGGDWVSKVRPLSSTESNFFPFPFFLVIEKQKKNNENIVTVMAWQQTFLINKEENIQFTKKKTDKRPHYFFNICVISALISFFSFHFSPFCPIILVAIQQFTVSKHHRRVRTVTSVFFSDVWLNNGSHLLFLDTL